MNRSNIRLLFTYRHNFNMQQRRIDDIILINKQTCIAFVAKATDANKTLKQKK